MKAYFQKENVCRTYSEREHSLSIRIIIVQCMCKTQHTTHLINSEQRTVSCRRTANAVVYIVSIWVCCRDSNTNGCVYSMVFGDGCCVICLREFRTMFIDFLWELKSGEVTTSVNHQKELNKILSFFPQTLSIVPLCKFSCQ